MLILVLFSVLFYIVYCIENRLKINITSYREIFYLLTYRDKIYNLECFIFEKFFTTYYGMDFWFSVNKGNIIGRCIWDGL